MRRSRRRPPYPPETIHAFVDLGEPDVDEAAADQARRVAMARRLADQLGIKVAADMVEDPRPMPHRRCDS